MTDYKQIIMSLPAGVAVIDVDGHFLFANPLFCHYSGYSALELPGISVGRLCVPGCDPLLPDIYPDTGASEHGVHWSRTQILCQDNRVRSMTVGVVPVEMQGMPCRELILCDARDGLGWDQGPAEDRQRKEGFSRGQRQILTDVIDPKIDLKTILESIVRLTEHYVIGMTASILLLDESRQHLIHGAASSLPDAYVMAINGARIGPSAGSCGTAAHRGERVIVEDISTDALWMDYRQLAFEHGLYACWSEPIKDAGHQTIGTFAFYYAEPKKPGAWELATIEDIARLAGIAIMHKRSMLELQRIDARLRGTQRIAHIGSWDLDLEKNVLWWSEEVYRIFAIDEADHQHDYAGFLNCVHPADREMVDEAYKRSVRDRVPYEVKHRLLLQNGTVRFVSERGETFYDASGQALRSLGTVQDISKQHFSEERLSWLSYYDDLTELPNRRMFLDRLQMAIGLAKRTGRSIVVLYFDLDRFKLINDTLGHAVGDMVLRTVADRVDRVLRSSDTVARFGGDEFAVLLPESESGNAIRVAEKIARTVQKPILMDEQELVVSVSAGAAIYPGDGEDAQILLQHADIAMYKAKATGQHICQFSVDMGVGLENRLALEQDLSRAIDLGQLSLYYQCQFSLRELNTKGLDAGDLMLSGVINSDHLAGCEALIRWQHPDKGWVSPVDFIPLAEETGMIQKITQWVVEAAATQALMWEQAGIRPSRISINISAIQLIHSALASDILSWIRAKGAQPAWFEVEITETAAMHNSETAQEIMSELVKAGLGISIDDFGTGYSSLAYLKRIPANVIKVDQSFVRGLPGDAEDMAIVRSTIAMAHALGKVVVAEGVETLEQLDFLHGEGCDIVQGFLLARPLDSQACSALLQSLQANAH